jgi:hypothetical protein
VRCKLYTSLAITPLNPKFNDALLTYVSMKVNNMTGYENTTRHMSEIAESNIKLLPIWYDQLNIVYLLLTKMTV